MGSNNNYGAIIMRKEHIAPGIIAYYDVMEDPQSFISDVEGLVEIKNLQWVPGHIRSVGDEAHIEHVVTTSIREVETIGLPAFDRVPDLKKNGGIALDLHEFLNKNVLPTAVDYAAEFGIQPYATGENWQILKYGMGHHFDNHIDDNKAFPRTFSISYYLNDDYEGGEIEFPRFGIKIKPEANQAIVFAANYVYNHKIYPVTGGTRYAIVNWFE
jgi:hypothetical protein